LNLASSSVKSWKASNPVTINFKERFKQVSSEKKKPTDEIVFTSQQAERLLEQIREEALMRLILNPKTDDALGLDVVRMSSSSFGSLSYKTQAEPDATYEPLVPAEMGMLSHTSETDKDLEFSPSSLQSLAKRCEEMGKEGGRFLKREMRKVVPQHTDTTNTNVKNNQPVIRVFQWNQLSQSLGTQNDNFVACPPSALEWSTRRWRILAEILRHGPHIICLQEVDHMDLLERALDSVGYSGHFLPKPDSPCLYLPHNTGPDGCAIFYRRDTFSLLREPAPRVIQVWGVNSNQVALGLPLRHVESGRELCVVTTHLKARQGPLLTKLRAEQGRDLVSWLQGVRDKRVPLLITGDFNATPVEPVVELMQERTGLNLRSAYRDPAYTTWCVREDGEVRSVLDYIFHSPDSLECEATLSVPPEQDIGEARLPSLAFPSDHLSLVADFKLLD